MTRLINRRTPNTSDPAPPAGIDPRRVVTIARIEGARDIGGMICPGSFGLASDHDLFGGGGFKIAQLAILIDTTYAKHAHIAAPAKEFAAALLERRLQARRAGMRFSEDGSHLWLPTDPAIALDEARDGRLEISHGVEVVLGAYLFMIDLDFRDFALPRVHVAEALRSVSLPSGEQKPLGENPRFLQASTTHAWERNPPGGDRL